MVHDQSFMLIIFYFKLVCTACYVSHVGKMDIPITPICFNVHANRNYFIPNSQVILLFFYNLQLHTLIYETVL